MNRILLCIILMLVSLWAVKPVTKTEKTDDGKKPVIKIQIPHEDKEDNKEQDNDIPAVNKSNGQNNKNDQFIDVDSNNVNDQRENDLLKIKQLKTKFKDFFKKDEHKEKTPGEPAKTKKSVKK